LPQPAPTHPAPVTIATLPPNRAVMPLRNGRGAGDPPAALELAGDGGDARDEVDQLALVGIRVPRDWDAANRCPTARGPRTRSSGSGRRAGASA
jgi:hypothetical protein